MSIVVKHVSKAFGGFVALDDVSLEVPTGTLVALLGPSGSGKTTLLRIIAGLEHGDRGSVVHGEQDITDLAARDRQVGFVFQHYALFRHMTIAENIGFGLKVRGVGKDERLPRVQELLRLIRLEGFGPRYPSQLSGGQRQRVALARALVAQPSVLLLDEPFGALDARVRHDLRQWLRKLHDEIHLTSLFVTHDQEEAFGVADHVVVMNHGKIEQVGTPAEILDRPATEFVARFVGDVNVVEAEVKEGRAHAGRLSAAVADHPEGARVRLVIRSYDMKFWRDDEGLGLVERIVPFGDHVRVVASVDGVGNLFAQFPRRSSLLHRVEPGCRIAIEVTLARAYPA